MNIQSAIFTVDLLQALLWQYSQAVTLQSLSQQKQDWYDQNQTQFWVDYYNNIFNLVTADEFGLAIWSILLNMPLFLDLSNVDNGKPIWGFNITPSSSANHNKNFTLGTFSTRGSTTVLTLEQQRLLLRLRYYQLVSNGTIPEINTFLATLFNPDAAAFQGDVFVLDNLNMTMTYVFKFQIPVPVLNVLVQLDVLPRPAGVGLTYVITPNQLWGFGEYFKNFGRGTFVNNRFGNSQGV